MARTTLVSVCMFGINFPADYEAAQLKFDTRKGIYSMQYIAQQFIFVMLTYLLSRKKICIMYNAHYCAAAYYLGRSISVLSCTATITPPSVIFHNTAVHFFHVTPLYRLLRSTSTAVFDCTVVLLYSILKAVTKIPHCKDAINICRYNAYRRNSSPMRHSFLLMTAMPWTPLWKRGDLAVFRELCPKGQGFGGCHFFPDTVIFATLYREGMLFLKASCLRWLPLRTACSSSFVPNHCLMTWASGFSVSKASVPSVLSFCRDFASWRIVDSELPKT
ncbi:hypothetical protein T03_13282 [Trichinella britovi]|uniref:Uncharacterized protein n=1 Tax=Trichinella britovi TaxID=45882 RepID=A0A0V1CNL0_TRIBR|nr:hypothetical protein T03_13282 [Trichinella britovi]